jgi:hypothetical protein
VRLAVQPQECFGSGVLRAVSRMVWMFSALIISTVVITATVGAVRRSRRRDTCGHNVFRGDPQCGVPLVYRRTVGLQNLKLLDLVFRSRIVRSAAVPPDNSH